MQTASRTARVLSGLAVAGVLFAASAGTAQAAEVQVQMATQNSTFNPGPFSNHDSTGFALSFTINGSSTGSGVYNWSGGLDNLAMTVTDSIRGSFTATARNGTWVQLQSSGGGEDYMLGGWGGSYGGTITASGWTNPGFSTTPFVLESISLEFRGADLYTHPSMLPDTPLSLADFNYRSLVLGFSNADPNVSNLDESSIIRGSDILAVSMTPVAAVPEPETWALLAAGLALITTVARRRRAA